MNQGVAAIRSLTQRQRYGRAVNAVADLLRQKLAVPHIFIEPRSEAILADVLAVDRAGSGDLHGVEIELHELGQSDQKVETLLRKLKKGAVHFQYLAVPDEIAERLMKLPLDWFAEDGLGKVGLIGLVEHTTESPEAKLRLSPERFRLKASRLDGIEKRLLSKRPDIEVRI